ncbi:MAG TPA: hypothetical protein VK348_06785, partial [Planctomycetota bacterium]|nr:hypothetical protein [Planctomycetota bacterium]
VRSTAGPCTITLTAGAEDLLPDWLGQLLLEPLGARLAAAAAPDNGMAEAFAALRARAFARCSLGASWVSDAHESASSLRATARPHVTAGPSGIEIVVSWPLPATVSALRIELPAGVWLRYTFTALVCADDSGLARSSGVEPLEAQDLARVGSELQVTGGHPAFTCGLAAGQSDRTVTLRGVAR